MDQHDPIDEKRRKNGYNTSVVPLTDTTTDAGMLRYQNEDLLQQIARMHDKINRIAETLGLDVPLANRMGHRYTPAARMDLLEIAYREQKRGEKPSTRTML